MRTNFLFAFVCLLFTYGGPLHAQQIDHNGHLQVRCHTMESDAALRARHPELGTLDDFENWLAPLVKEYASVAHPRAVSTIPVIFHVIHDNDAVGTGDNISATYINAQITQLNNDFRRILGTSGHNTNAVGADSEIEFCAAVVDQAGNSLAEPGINRINRSSQGWSAPPFGGCVGGNFDDTYIENTIKPQSQWNPDNYFNIWVMDVSCGILGYAQFPSSSGLPGMPSNGGVSSTDGVVLLTTSLGSTDVPNPSGGAYNKGRTATHEVGHFFGLRHIWGDGGCTVDDFCNDTPTSDGANYGCPVTTSCGSTDMVENYMDYTDDNCMNTYTLDQKVRMQTVLSNSPRRGTLANSTACTGGGGGGSCTTTISSFPYSEGFESSFGNWSQSTADDFDWSRLSGSTPSSNTGPASAVQGSYYVYMESSSPNYPSKRSILTGPCFDLSSASSATFAFQYHCYGASTMGSLSLEARPDGGSWSSVWSVAGNQGNAWLTASVDLSSFLGSTVELRFNGLTGTTWQGDMAVDDISLSTGGGGGGCQDNDLTLTIVLDNYGSETTWQLSGSGGVVASGGPYTDNSTGTIITESICAVDDCYDFTIFDAYGDGICCAYGNGSYDLSDGVNSLASGGSFASSETTSFCLPAGGGGCPSIDFNSYTINAYGAGQDQGTHQVQDAGATLYIENNAWKSISYAYTVTANTVIEFDFRSTAEGEIHSIGFDNDDAISSNLSFRVYGTQAWGIGDFDNYSPSAWTTYTIPVGNYYTGAFDRLFFTVDEDATPRDGVSYFRNVKIYEGSCGSGNRQVRADMTNPNAMTLYPNPTTDLLNVSFNQKLDSQTELKVMDIAGRVVSREVINTYEGRNEYSLDVSGIQPGSYMIVIANEYVMETKPFLIVR